MHARFPESSHANCHRALTMIGSTTEETGPARRMCLLMEMLNYIRNRESGPWCIRKQEAKQVVSI